MATESFILSGAMEGGRWCPMYTAAMLRVSAALGLIVAIALPLQAAGPADALIVLRVTPPSTADRIYASAPLRFALLKSGQFYVGGTTTMAKGFLDNRERKDLEKRMKKVLKLKGVTAEVRLGPGETRYELKLGEKKPRTFITLGDPAKAPASLRELGSLIAELADFDHASIRPYVPQRFALSARVGELPGGCRSWTFPRSLEAVLESPSIVSAQAARGWPWGPAAASVCHEGEHYVVNLRPLVPGESWPPGLPSRPSSK